MHENLYFLNEDLSIGNFIRNLELAEKQIENDALMLILENLNEKSENYEKLSLQYQKSKNLFEKVLTTPKMSRKIQLFIKKLAKLQNLIQKKSQKFIEDFVYSQKENFQIKSELLNYSLPIDFNIRSGTKRNFVKTLEEMFEVANSEIFKSKTFKKLLMEQKISIPLACDVKCD
jgi:hypothetical protein